MEDDLIKDFKAFSFVDLMVLYDPRNTMRFPKFLDTETGQMCEFETPPVTLEDPAPMRASIKKKNECEEIMDSIYDLQKRLGV